MRLQDYNGEKSSENTFVLTCCLKSYLNYPEEDIWLKIMSSACGIPPREFKKLLLKKILTGRNLCDMIYNISYGAVPKYKRNGRVIYTNNIKKNYCVCNMFKRRM